MYLGLKESGMTLESAALSMNGTLYGADKNTRFYGICTDSRKVGAGELFFAIVGEKMDGNDFAASAVSLGASCAVVSRAPRENIPHILVKDTREALGLLAKAHHELLPCLTVGVTGSVGKTTTKEFIAAVLAEKYDTAKTKGNFNNDIGLPLTLFSFARPKNALVLEMGMSARGEIAHLTKIARPDIGVITNIGSSHLENLGTRENIALAKLEITEGMRDGAPLILNGDEPLLKNLENFKTNNIFVSLIDKNCEFFAYNIREEASRTLFDCKARTRVWENVCIPAVGKHNVYNALCAIAVGTLADMDEESVRRGLMSFAPCDMRGGVREKDGIRIIEDCYNASPESMRASLSSLCRIAGGARKIAFLGEMRELGPESAAMHFSVGEFAASTGIDLLFTFGTLAEEIAKGAVHAGFARENIVSLADTQDVCTALKKLKLALKEGDVILFKASRALKLERISREI
ncbi:MAG: UDP-N-acetylmuramoyl-tripeptide--D-alanyl-D-alanine ligase [Ruminococcaceae bacterium]|nr:UDP-N-acetylmuramoyl-tripeptide--D-alanyl-D-alanine ligase [Oscillospiraceae bacterium]